MACKRTLTRDDGQPSATHDSQVELEETILAFHQRYREKLDQVTLNRNGLGRYLSKGLKRLNRSFQALDSSRPWLCYWIGHALALVGRLSESDARQIADFLGHVQDPLGGFCGGPGQQPHLASCYAASRALAVCGTEYAFSKVNRATMHRFLLERKDARTGGFSMHESGEVDVRATYCALATAHLFDLVTDELVEGAAEYIVSCQTYEGGIGQNRWNEAHGGYTFCGVAALHILGQLDALDVPRLLDWLTSKQLALEGGFCGRTNKLVDSCYSFWQGAVFPIIHSVVCETFNVPQRDDAWTSQGGLWLFDQFALQQYILLCAQPYDGGFRDKPGKARDYYHTCYAISGLAAAQNEDIQSAEELVTVLGVAENRLPSIDPVHNVETTKLAAALEYFRAQPRPHV